MTAAVSWSKEFTLTFIQIYKESESLWNFKNPDYFNKRKKEEAYESLIKLVKNIEPRANKDMVTKKINNLRTSFRRHLRALENSYAPKEPSLYYFQDLMFLKENDPAMNSDFEDVDQNSSFATIIKIEPEEILKSDQENGNKLDSEVLDKVIPAKNSDYLNLNHVFSIFFLSIYY